MDASSRTQATELAIYNLDDRLKVAEILIKNGYKVSQGKRNRGGNTKSVDYVLVIEKAPDGLVSR